MALVTFRNREYGSQYVWLPQLQRKARFQNGVLATDDRQFAGLDEEQVAAAIRQVIADGYLPAYEVSSRMEELQRLMAEEERAAAERVARREQAREQAREEVTPDGGAATERPRAGARRSEGGAHARG